MSLCLVLILSAYQTHRWRPIAPLILPHATEQDLPYKEYIIPQESVIYVDSCTWTPFPAFHSYFACSNSERAGAITHDSGTFEDPQVFRPERWFKPELRDEQMFDLMFGTGGVRTILLDGRSFCRIPANAIPPSLGRVSAPVSTSREIR